jgi:nucleotide-binding universal stress UspA family protein
LAKQWNAELALVHVFYVPPVTDAGERQFPPEVVQEMLEDARRSLAASVKDALALGATRVTSALPSGAPWHAIVDAAKDAVDLIVVGTHGRTGFSRIMVGSVAEQVVRHAPCSVLAVRADGEARPFNHVLCPIDFSDSSQQALSVAAALVEPAGKITLLHVVEMPAAYRADVPLVRYVPDLETRSIAALAKWSTQLEDKFSVTTRSRIGRPGAETIAAIDEDASIDLVVMGSHGRTGIKRVLLGSVAEKVVRHARCPVLVARKR